MTAMSLLGVSGGDTDLIDCTSALPAAVTAFTPKTVTTTNTTVVAR